MTLGGGQKEDPGQTLAAEIRSALAEIRAAAGGGPVALFLLDPEDHRLRVQACVPRRVRRSLVHPLAADCILTTAVELGKPISETSRRNAGGSTCDACRDLFGAPASFAIPIGSADGQLAVVAAFTPAGRLAGRRVTAAFRLARRLGTFLTSCATMQQAQRRAADLAAINQVAARLTRLVDPALLFPEILAEIGRVVPFDLASLYLFDPEEERLRLIASAGFPAKQSRLLAETTWNGLPAVVFRSQQPVIIQDLPGEHGRSEQSDLPNRCHAVLAAPILSVDGPLGVMCLGSFQPSAFGSQAREVVTLLSDHVAIAIANARLHQQVERRLHSKLRDLTNLSQIGQAVGASLQTEAVLESIVQRTAEAFESPASAIVLLSEARDELVLAAARGPGARQIGLRFRPEGSIHEWIIRQGEPRLVLRVPDVPSPAPRAPIKTSDSVSDASVDPALIGGLRAWLMHGGMESFIGVPLVVRGEAIGTLCVCSRRGRLFDASDIELLQGLAAQAAIAIEHADLYESLARQKARIEGIVESLHEGLVLVSPSGAIAYASQRFADLVGIDPQRLSPPTMDQLRDWLVARCPVPAEASEQLQALESESRPVVALTLAEPCRRDLAVQSFSVRAPAGDLLGRGYVVRDVTHEVAVERLKASILSTVSHELRTPLAAIKGFATSLLRADIEWDEASKRDFVEQIDREADRLSVLVANLLDMSRLEAGVFSVDREWCDLGELMAIVVARMAPVVADHRIRLVVSGPRVFAFVDRQYVDRVLRNLIDNAVKYSPSGSLVTVGLARVDREIVLTVSDQGVGIAPDERERIFERFYRSARARPAPGVGLGLAICRGIIQAHGGTITVDSVPGRGSTFSVRLPDGLWEG